MDSPESPLISQVFYVIQETTRSTFDKRDLYPILCDDCTGPFLSEIKEDGTKNTATPLTVDNLNLKILKPSQVKQLESSKVQT